jgi:hypothetical protein
VKTNRDTSDDRLHSLTASELDHRLKTNPAVIEPTPQPDRGHVLASHAHAGHGQLPSALKDCDPGQDLRILNLTAHDVTLVGENDAEQMTLPRHGPSARVVLAGDSPCGRFFIAGLQVHVVRTAATQQIVGLPDRRSGVLLIVSRMVAAAAPDRDDLVFPHDSVRDDRGTVIKCRRLGSVHPRSPLLPSALPLTVVNDAATKATQSRCHDWNRHEPCVELRQLDETREMWQAARPNLARASQTP